VEVSVDEKRAANVTCAKVDATLRETSADHAVVKGNEQSGVVGLAGSSVEDGDDHLQEGFGRDAIEVGVAPSRDDGFGADGAGGALGQKVDGGGVGVPGESVGNLRFGVHSKFEIDLFVIVNF